MRTFAAIDVGSFELELCIYEMSAKFGIRRVDYVRHEIPLGRDVYNGGKISYRLVEELCQVLGEFMRIMKEYQVTDYRAYATTAVREADNSKIMLDQIRVRTGVDIRVISNSEQRYISYKALAGKGDEFQKIIQNGAAVVDVGFGSMQVSLFDKDALISTQNLPLGLLRLKTLVQSVQVTSEVEQRLVQELVENEMVTYRKINLKDQEIRTLIGIGDSVLKMCQKMEEIRKNKKAWKDGDSQEIKEIQKDGGLQKNKEARKRDWITRSEFQDFYKKLCTMTQEQIQDAFDVNGEYASMIFPAAAILKQLMELTGAEEIWVPGVRMCDGMAADYAEEKKVISFGHDFINDIMATSRNMAKRYKCHMAHVQNVEKEALLVFDNLKKYHGLKARERLLLQIAAVLHSCGKFVAMRNAGECAYNIIMSTEIVGLSHVEREIVANVVRFNVKPFRYNEVRIESKPSRFTRLAAPDNLVMVVAKLTAMLRLANSMDRGHKGKLLDGRFAVKKDRLVISTDYQGDVLMETMSIAQMADFFEEIFGIRPVLKQKKRV